MEFIGQTVKKEFIGYGIFSGIVKSYDPSSGFFEILYEDGDSEELELAEVASLLVDKSMVMELSKMESELVEKKPRLGRKPKKRRRVEIRDESGNSCANDAVSESVEKKSLNSNDELSLNNGLNLNDDDGFNSNDELNLNVSAKENWERTKSFDLNLKVEGDFDEAGDMGNVKVETRKKECPFDLNLGFDEESKDDLGGELKESIAFEIGGELKESNAFEMVEETPQKGIGGFVGETRIEGIVRDGVCLDSVDENPLNGLTVYTEPVSKDTHLGFVEQIGKGEAGVSDANCFEDGTPEVLLKGFDNELRENIGSSYKGATRGRKRRKLSDGLKPTTGSVLRRSSRRGAAATLPAPNHLLETMTSSSVNDVPSSPMLAIATEEKPEELSLPPVKLQLPPSSQNLDLDGVPLLDIFSIYACLRSFSTILFLSPFELEDFVAALKCKSPNSLFDCIHVSILQTLRKHLEFLSAEGSQSASNCLRCLNWGLLDLITWPLYMVEYLLIQGSSLRSEFDLSRLKLFKCDYYKQPACVKTEILRCLCDDVIEGEAIRSELNRRSLVAERAAGYDRNVNGGTCKKRRAAMDVPVGSSSTDEVVDETADGNSDECCLCKMDGNLICCDGCPAAYHSRCVGVASDLLPEGDWYCPECVIDKKNPWMKSRKSLRGAELLGIDPHGRFYYSSCGYLLVLESCDNESCFNYYHRNDLNVVIDVLKSSDIRFGGVLDAISKHWDIPIHCSEVNSNLDSQYRGIYANMILKGQIRRTCRPSSTLPPTGTCAAKDENVDEKKGQDNSDGAEFSDQMGLVVEKPSNLLDAAGGNNNMEIENSVKDSEGSAEIIDAENTGKTAPLGDSCLTSSTTEEKRENILKSAIPDHLSSAINKTEGVSSQVDIGIAYMNYYNFAQMASSVAEELMDKSLDKFKVDSTKSIEEIIATQLKAISEKSSKFCWLNIQNINIHVQKEKCGWCYSCKAPDDDKDCLLMMNDAGPVQEDSKSEVVGLQSKRNNRKGHIINVIGQILSIEDRLHGLLLGPWLNPHYSKLWRKSVVKAPDVKSVKKPLLKLETNLRRLALSTEWLKHVDAVVTMGSASHIVTSSVRVASKNGTTKKRGRFSNFDTPSSKAASGLSTFWWRGGRVSRHLFNWKVLPQPLARKAARQAGCTKIPGIFYPESSEFAKRNKNVAWRAAVETSASAEQLAFLVRDLDLNIKWDDIENTHPQSKMDDFKKSLRFFKKVVIRRKTTEGTVVKYLLDFGKRKFIPDIVVRHGSMLEQSSSGRKKYWLEESHVPLHLLKFFEEKRIARKANKMKSGKLVDGGRIKKKPSGNRGFLYLFSKAERSEYYQCGHCNKDVLIREAVSCQDCEGFYHKRHVRKSAGAITAKCTYTCHRCHEGKHVKIDTKKGKVPSQVSKKSTAITMPVHSQRSKRACVERRTLRSQNKNVSANVPLRRSPRKVKYVSLQNKKTRGRKKGKQVKSKKGASIKPKKGASWQKKRSHIYHTYWLNGLLLSKKPNDERVVQFRRKKLLLPSEDLTVILDQPKCHLCCEAEYTSTLNYISCEICGDWFHGDAFGLGAENIGYLIGFRCHACRKRVPPSCPHLQSLQVDVTQSGEVKSNAGVECSEGVPNDVPPPGEGYVKPKSHSDEDSISSFLIDESHHDEEQSGMVPNLNQAMGLQSTLELESGGVMIKQKTDTTQHSSDKVLKPNILTEVNDNLSVNESTNLSGKVHGGVDSLVEAEVKSCKSDVDVTDKLAPHNNAKDGFVETMPTLKSAGD